MGVVVTLADRHYLEQAKQLFSTVYWNSGWSGDYVLLAHDVPEPETKWFIDRGIIVRHCKPLDVASDKKGDEITASKCYLFDEWFKRWRNVVYLDTDILTRGSIDHLGRVSGFHACHSLGQTVRDNVLPGYLEGLNLDRKAFNSGVMAFSTDIIQTDTLDKVLQTFNRYVKAGTFGGDQLPFNMHFDWSELPPAFNDITSLEDRSIDPESMDGLVIHCVLFGQGPWDQTSPFYPEWKCNYDRADGVDVRRPHSVSPVGEAEIADRSRRIRARYVRGGGYLSMAVKAAKLLLTNPGKILHKARMLRG